MQQELKKQINYIVWGNFLLSLITKELDGTLSSNISFYFLVIFISCNDHYQKKNEKRNNFLGQ